MEYLFNSLDYETKLRLLSTKKLKLRGLASSDFRVKFPLEPLHNRKVYKALVLTPLAPPEKILVGLLWTALFGKTLRVYHWLLLFNLTLKTINAESSEALIKILLLLYTEKSGKSWNQRFKPVKTRLFQLMGDNYTKELQSILERLPYQLPKKNPMIENLIGFEIKKFKLQKPKEPRRIGVGYKDKGNLPSGVKPDLEVSEFLFDLEDKFFHLNRQIKSRYPYNQIK